MPETCAIILAAGKSERMGTNKLLLPFHGKPMINKVIDHVQQSEVDHIWIVLGAFRDDMLAAIRDLPVNHCFNADYEQGMFTSVQCGFRNMPSSADAAIVYLGDQPMIPAEVTRKIIRAFGQSDKGILIPVYRGRKGHPVLIAKKYKVIIDTLFAPEGMHTFMEKYREDILEVEVQTPGILRDIDTKQDYKNEIKLN
jgi:molybdenum cofactor cytidylyltransferase